jgi:hypothetical protein
MKRDSIEADSMSSTRLRRKTSCESERVHREECTETEDINSTAQQAVAYIEKHASFNKNYIMNEHDKRRNSDKKAMIQR